MLRVSPEPAQYVAVQHAQYTPVEMTDLAAAATEIIAPVAPAAYHLPPTLRLSRVLRVSLFGLGRAGYAYQPAAPAAADAALPSDDAV